MMNTSSLQQSPATARACLTPSLKLSDVIEIAKGVQMPLVFNGISEVGVWLALEGRIDRYSRDEAAGGASHCRERCGARRDFSHNQGGVLSDAALLVLL